MVPQLHVGHGRLFFGGYIILRMYGAGDCDTVAWPFGSDGYDAAQDRENLAVALYDMYECGSIKERTVALPDGSAFNIDTNMPTKAQVDAEGE